MEIEKFAHLDLERPARCGVPEAIYCEGKKTSQIVKIMKATLDNKSPAPIIATRATQRVYRAVKKEIKEAKYYKEARIIAVTPKKSTACLPPRTLTRYVCVVTAGTTDIPVAEECAVTSELLGTKVERIYDVGVAGMHRVLKFRDKLTNASCVVVCAGMEGALPSVVGGLVSCPVIGVPTSVGYGANFGGVSALITMLNSCAPNISVVNIDDGFGAGVIAHLIDVRFKMQNARSKMQDG